MESNAKSCSKYAEINSIISSVSGKYILGNKELSWFGAQKFCHQNGWLFGALMSSALDKDLQLVKMLGSNDLWGNINSIGSKGTVLSNSESGKPIINEFSMSEKASPEKACVIYSGLGSGKMAGKPEVCTKRAKFFCQLPPLCPMTFESCKDQNDIDDDNFCPMLSSEDEISKKNLISSLCDGPICQIPPSCTDRLKNNLQSVDPEVYLPIGQLISSCGKKYYFAKEHYPLNISTDFCCSIGMTLVSIENKAKLKCVADAIAKLDVIKDGVSRWWTSATDAGCPGKMAWCGSGESFSEAELGRLDGFKGKERCVALKGSTLVSATCEENNRPICEGDGYPSRTYYHWKCPTVQCRMNLDSLSVKSEYSYIIDEPPRSLGQAVQFDTFFYFIGRGQVTWHEAQAKCCSLGMKIMSPNSAVVMERMQKLMQEKVKDENIKPKPEKMTFWTGGYEWKKSQFTWCHSGEDFPNFGTWEDVKVSLSSKEENSCVIAVLGDKYKGLETASCASKQYFMCTHMHDTTDPNKCNQGKCYYHPSTADMKFASKADVKALETTTKGKVMLDTCKRHMLLPRESYTLSEITRVCHSYGMRLITPESEEDLTCILNAVNKLDYGTLGFSLHLPFTDLGCRGKLVLCGTGRPFNASWIKWRGEYSLVRLTPSISAYMHSNDPPPKLALWRNTAEEYNKGLTKRRVLCETPAS